TRGTALTPSPVTASVTGGVLTTTAFDFTMPLVIQIVTAELKLTDGRLRLTLAQDGSASGVLGGTWATSELVAILGEPTQQNSDNPDDPDKPGAAGFSLNGLKAALATHADRDPSGDPVACAGISAVFAVDAVAAFLVD